MVLKTRHHDKGGWLGPAKQLPHVATVLNTLLDTLK
jgi:hypothetical protein